MESPLLSLQVRDASGRRRPPRRRGKGTRPGARVWFPPPSRSQSGMRVGDDVHRDDGATARGRALGMESPLLSLPVRDASRRRRPQRRRGDGIRPGAKVWFPPPLLLPVRDASGGRRPQRRRSDGTRPGVGDGVSPPLAPSQGCEQGTTMAVPRGYEGDERIRSILGRADPEQGPP